MIAVAAGLVLMGVALCGAGIYIGVIMWRDDERVLGAFMFAVALAVPLLAIGIAVLPRDERPCVRYETTYVMSGKVLVPVRSCAERGEWVK